MNAPEIDSQDAPIFAPEAFRLNDAQAELINQARRFGRSRNVDFLQLLTRK
jgi:hypothetical protein